MCFIVTEFITAFGGFEVGFNKALRLGVGRRRGHRAVDCGGAVVVVVDHVDDGVD